MELLEVSPRAQADLREITDRVGFSDEDVQLAMKALSGARPPYFSDVVEIGELPYPIQI